MKKYKIWIVDKKWVRQQSCKSTKTNVFNKPVKKVRIVILRWFFLVANYRNVLCVRRDPRLPLLLFLSDDSMNFINLTAKMQNLLWLTKVTFYRYKILENCDSVECMVTVQSCWFDIESMHDACILKFHLYPQCGAFHTWIYWTDIFDNGKPCKQYNMFMN